MVTDSSRCSGQHDIYVVECLYIARDGKLVVVTACRACDAVNFHEKLVASPHTPAELLKGKQNEL